MTRLILFSLIVLSSCRYDEITLDTTKDHLVFGTFYGMCVGNCVNFYVMEGNALYEVNNHQYPSQQLRVDISSLTKLDDAKYQSVQKIWTEFPERLKFETQTVFGCPDCTDAGGTYIEITTGNDVKYWYIDNSGRDVPLYIQEYTNLIIRTTRDLSQ